MSARGVVDIMFRARGAQAVRSTIRGVAQETKKSERDSIALARRVEREKIQAARRSARAQVTSAQWAMREETRLTREGARAAAQAEREKVRAAQRADAEIRRSSERLHREQQRRTRAAQRDVRGRMTIQRGANAGLMTGAAGIGAIGIGALTTALDAFASRLDTVATAIASQSGQLDLGSRTTAAMDFDLGLRRAEFFGDQDTETRAASMADLRREVEGVAIATGQAPTDMLDMLNGMQANFSEFESGRRGLRAIADEANRTGASMEEVGQFVGVVNQTLGDTAPSASRLFDIMAQQGIRGNVSPEEMARDFMPMLGMFTGVTGQTGEDAFRSFTGIAQAMRPGFGSSEEAATGMQSLMAAVGDDRTRARIIQATGGRARTVRGADGLNRVVGDGGTQAFGADGTVDMLRLIEDLGQVEGVGTTGLVFHNVRARQAFGQLARLRSRDAAGEDVETAAELAGADADAGSRFRTGRIAEVNNSESIRAKRQGAQTAVEGMHEMRGRAEASAEVNAYAEAGRTLPGLAMLNSFIPDSLETLIMPTIARQMAMTEGQRGIVDAIGQGAAGFGAIGAPIMAAAPMVSALGGAGAQMNQSLQSARGKQQVEGMVELGPRTIVALGRALMGAQPRPPVPGRTPG